MSLHEQPWMPSLIDQDGVATSRKAELFTFDQSQFVHDLMIFVLITVEFLQSKRSKRCKSSGTEVTKKNVNHFQQRWQYHKMCICARSPTSCKLQASMASLHKEATARDVDARRCQKRLKTHDDIK